MYKLIDGGVILLATGATIPEDPTNADWQEYLAWVALGNTPAPADALPGPTAGDVAQGGVKAWFVAHPNAALLFNLSIADLDIEIDGMADALFPAASGVSNANKNRFKLWAKTVSHSVRALAKREGFTA